MEYQDRYNSSFWPFFYEMAQIFRKNTSLITPVCKLASCVRVIIHVKIVSVTTNSRSKKCSYKFETHLLHPFWKGLHKISRTISFEHNALRESRLFWQLSCPFRASVFILFVIFSDLFCRFSSAKSFTLTWGQISFHYLWKFFRLWASWFSRLTRWSFFSVTVDCRELA